MTKTVAFTIKPRSTAALARYKDLHRNVPEAIVGTDGVLRWIGLHSMEIYEASDRLFMIVAGRDGFDPVTDFRRANGFHPAVQAWDDIMHGELLDRVDGNDGPLHWLEMEPVFLWHSRQAATAPQGSRRGFQLLDCTVRDGGYYTGWTFSDVFISRLMAAAIGARVDVVEMGYLRPTPPAGDPLGLALGAAAGMLAPLDPRASHRPRLAVMIDTKNWQPMANGASAAILSRIAALPAPIDMVRIASRGDVVADDPAFTLSLINAVADAGYVPALNLMQVAMTDSAKLPAIAAALSEADPRTVIYVADTFGSMKPDSVGDLIDFLRARLPHPIGFHGHDNMGLALVNCDAAVRAGADWIDGTFGGMGRGAGNAATERLVHLRASSNDLPIDLKAIWEFLDTDIAPLLRHYGWGMSAVYAACADNKVHPSYGQTIEATRDKALKAKLELIQQLGLIGAQSFEAQLMTKLSA